MIKRQIKRGEVYLANLEDRMGSIQSGVRPIVVISNPQNNKFSPTINVLPVTSRAKINIPVHVNIGVKEGLERQSVILTEQVLTINKYQLIKYIGRCSNDKMQEIAKAMVLQFHMMQELKELLVI